MRRILLISATLLLFVPLFARTTTIEESAALAKMLYESTVQVIEDKNWVIIPDTYDSKDGIENNSGIDSFLSCEKGVIYSQGVICCGMSDSYKGGATEYSVKTDKKGNIKMKIVVRGDYLKGTYTIAIRNGSNTADVIFNPLYGLPKYGSSCRRFSGPIVSCVGAEYNKRANPL